MNIIFQIEKQISFESETTPFFKSIKMAGTRMDNADLKRITTQCV